MQMRSNGLHAVAFRRYGAFRMHPCGPFYNVFAGGGPLGGRSRNPKNNRVSVPPSDSIIRLQNPPRNEVLNPYNR
ncbi:hypothetical protein EVAR_61652_1 [Eumeta japonica]|uniref:Uncharacterized protein n=1 Tax=Eumeta variegata TaxID=151549 RepID=A0A4C1ZAU8_EUMVA|nr:hypothetical protein EVAR_61652_1 [Eumeta japonica]